MKPPPICLTTTRLLLLIFTLSFTTTSPFTDAFSDSLFARLQKRLQYLARAHNNEQLGSNGTSSYGNTSEAPPPPPPLLIERVIERLHKERELAFDQIVPEAAEVLKKLAADGDLKACYSDSIKEVKVNLFKRTLGDVVRHFFVSFGWFYIFRNLLKPFPSFLFAETVPGRAGGRPAHHHPPPHSRPGGQHSLHRPHHRGVSAEAEARAQCHPNRPDAPGCLCTDI